MSTTRFLENDALWTEISKRAGGRGRVLAAVAYMGKNGANLLPLKKGDRLVVDMSLGAVKQGVTDPKEIRKLQNRGVAVFTRAKLHAKFVIAGQTLIAGSANVSTNSQQVLDEAGIVTNDAAAIKRAKAFFEKLCTESVRKEYLKQCLAAYRPPQFKAAVEPGKRVKGQKRVRQAKLWFIGGITPLDLTEDTRQSIAKVEEKAKKRLRETAGTEVSWIRFGQRPKFLDGVRVGDWIVQCVKNGSTRTIRAPDQVLGEEEWVSPRGKKYVMLMLETLDSSEEMTLGQFRKRVRAFEPKLDRTSPRAQPIENDEHADRILRLWTSKGKVSKR